MTHDPADAPPTASDGASPYPLDAHGVPIIPGVTVPSTLTGSALTSPGTSRTGTADATTDASARTHGSGAPGRLERALTPQVRTTLRLLGPVLVLAGAAGVALGVTTLGDSSEVWVEQNSRHESSEDGAPPGSLEAAVRAQQETDWRSSLTDAQSTAFFGVGAVSVLVGFGMAVVGWSRTTRPDVDVRS